MSEEIQALSKRIDKLASAIDLLAQAVALALSGERGQQRAMMDDAVDAARWLARAALAGGWHLAPRADLARSASEPAPESNLNEPPSPTGDAE